jgi:hypothetical protein
MHGAGLPTGCGKLPPEINRWNRVDVGKNLAWPQIRRQAIPGWKITIVKVQIVKNADYQADIGSGTPGAIQVTNLYATARNGSASDSVNASISSKVDPGSAWINDRPASVAYVNQRRHVIAPALSR